MLSRPTLRTLGLALATLSFSGLIIAADKPVSPKATEEIIQQRQENFEQLGGAFKVIRDEVRKRKSDMDAIVKAANTIHSHAQELPSWFPTGSGPEAGIETEALPAIWKDQAGFAAASQKFLEASENLLTLTETGDASKVASGIPALGGSCKNCHDNYRKD